MLLSSGWGNRVYRLGREPAVGDARDEGVQDLAGAHEFRDREALGGLVLFLDPDPERNRGFELGLCGVTAECPGFDCAVVAAEHAGVTDLLEGALSCLHQRVLAVLDPTPARAAEVHMASVLFVELHQAFRQAIAQVICGSTHLVSHLQSVVAFHADDRERARQIGEILEFQVHLHDATRDTAQQRDDVVVAGLRERLERRVVVRDVESDVGGAVGVARVDDDVRESGAPGVSVTVGVADDIDDCGAVDGDRIAFLSTNDRHETRTFWQTAEDGAHQLQGIAPELMNVLSAVAAGHVLEGQLVARAALALTSERQLRFDVAEARRCDRDTAGVGRVVVDEQFGHQSVLLFLKLFAAGKPVFFVAGEQQFDGAVRFQCRDGFHRQCHSDAVVGAEGSVRLAVLAFRHDPAILHLDVDRLVERVAVIHDHVRVILDAHSRHVFEAGGRRDFDAQILGAVLDVLEVERVGPVLDVLHDPVLVAGLAADAEEVAEVTEDVCGFQANEGRMQFLHHDSNSI